MMILVIILAILAFLAIQNTHQDPRLVQLKSMYRTFLTKLPEKYNSIKNKNTIISGRKKSGIVGENVNKGEEITVCLDGGDINSMFHILIHEIAHSSVQEYDHSGEFWRNYKELTDIAVQHGLYTPGIDKAYCGQRIQDGFT